MTPPKPESLTRRQMFARLLTGLPVIGVILGGAASTGCTTTHNTARRTSRRTSRRVNRRYD